MYIKGEMAVDIICIISIILQTVTTNHNVIIIAYLVLIAMLFLKAFQKYDNLRPFIDHNFAK
jgi:uncharacterized membrane protein